MGIDRAFATPAQATAGAVSGTQAGDAAAGAYRHSVRAQDRNSLERVAAGNGLRFRADMLALVAGLATPRRLEPSPPSRVVGIAGSRPTRLVACGGGQRFSARRPRGKKTGPNPTDRAKAGSKHHLLSDAQGIPLAAILTPANAHDVTQLLPLVDAIPAVAGKPGRPRQRPDSLQGDQAYDSKAHRLELRARNIKSLIARRGRVHGSGLGKTRWVIERSLSWLHQFRRLRVRYERLPEMHEAFLILGCVLICANFLSNA